MKSILLILIPLSFMFMITEIFPQEKKPAIILYDNGTWEKVEENSTSTQSKDIAEVWNDFKKDVKQNIKDLIMGYFMFPFEINLSLLEWPSGKCIRPVCDLKGAVSKSKLEENFTKLFDNDFKKSILEKKADEYIQGISKKLNSTSYKYEIIVDNRKNMNNENKYSKIKYVLSFTNNNGKYQIFSIYITFED